MIGDETGAGAIGFGSASADETGAGTGGDPRAEARTQTEWERFFDGYASRYMNEPFTTATVAEVDFLERELEMSAPARVLDLGCGTGRHSVELASRGYQVTGVDLSMGMLDQARAAACAAGVSVCWVRADARSYRPQDRFDVALCLCEGSLGLLAAGDDPISHDLSILETLARALRPGGRFALTALNAFRLARSDAAGFDAETSSESSVMSWADGETEHSIAVRERSFTPTELSLLCRVAGLEVEWAGGGTAGNWGRRPLDLDEYEIMVVGHAPGSVWPEVDGRADADGNRRGDAGAGGRTEAGGGLRVDADAGELPETHPNLYSHGLSDTAAPAATAPESERLGIPCVTPAATAPESERLGIRPVTPADAGPVSLILNDIIAGGRHSIIDHTFSEEEERRFIEHFPARGVFLVAELAGTGIVGFQALEPYTDLRAFDHVATVGTWVATPFRRHGVGRRLAAVTFDAARANGFTRLFTDIRADNRESLAFHRNLGFRVVGVARDQGCYGDRLVDVVYVEKDLHV